SRCRRSRTTERPGCGGSRSLRSAARPAMPGRGRRIALTRLFLFHNPAVPARPAAAGMRPLRSREALRGNLLMARQARNRGDSTSPEQAPATSRAAMSGDPVPPPRRGLLDRDWQKALVILLTVLTALVLAWVGVQIIRPIVRTLLLFALSGVLAFVLAAPVKALAARIGNRPAAIV